MLKYAFVLTILAVFIVGCGPQKVISYKADNKIRADYLVDSVRVKFKIEPECRSIYWLYIFWTVKCKEPYSLHVSVVSKHQSNDSNTLSYQSLKVITPNREYEMLTSQDTSKRIALTPNSNGTSSHQFISKLGKLITKEKTETFKVALLYRLGNQEKPNLVEKEFDNFEERHFVSIFSEKN